jgi:hypothetical protein
MSTIDRSALGRSNRNRGANVERKVAGWLRTDGGFPGAERAVRNGFRTVARVGLDPMDILGTPGLVWSVKDDKSERIEAWMLELDVKRLELAADIGVLVQRRRGKSDVGRWWAHVRFEHYIGVRGITASGIVRMELKLAATWLHKLGYGTGPEHE